MNRKSYLGDSVWAEFDVVRDRVVLTTENGYRPSNRVVIEREVWEALLVYMEHTPFTHGTETVQTGEPQKLEPVVHFFIAGETACDMPGPGPSGWPHHHRWSSVWLDVNCQKCLRLKPAISEPETKP